MGKPARGQRRSPKAGLQQAPLSGAGTVPAPFRRAFELELEPWPEGVILQVNGGKTGVKAGRDLRGVLDREKGGWPAP
jgi:hypothetical protein